MSPTLCGWRSSPSFGSALGLLLAGCAFGDPGSDGPTGKDTGEDTAPTTGDETGDETGDDTGKVTWAGPDLTLTDCAGTDTSLASLAVGTEGLVAAIGASWCEPCQADAPILEAFHVAHPSLGVVQILVQDVSGNPATHLACDQWVADFAISHPVLVDPAFTTADLVGGDGFPTHLVWAPNGEERYHQQGSFDADAVLAALGG